jgi:hypothetical protein
VSSVPLASDMLFPLLSCKGNNHFRWLDVSISMIQQVLKILKHVDQDSYSQP